MRAVVSQEVSITETDSSISQELRGKHTHIRRGKSEKIKLGHQACHAVGYQLFCEMDGYYDSTQLHRLVFSHRGPR